jgi:acyl dehydratase
VSATAPAEDVNAVITDEVRSWIGRTTELVPLPEEISASDVRRYVEATGDRNPLWLDDDAARSTGYRARILPPMMLIDLTWRLKNTESGRLTDRIPLPASYVDTRNADTEMEWLDPVYIGDRLSIRHRIRDIVARPGRRGLGIYITRETEYVRQDGHLVARVLQTVVRFPKAKLETD